MKFLVILVLVKPWCERHRVSIKSLCDCHQCVEFEYIFTYHRENTTTIFIFMVSVPHTTRYTKPTSTHRQTCMMIQPHPVTFPASLQYHTKPYPFSQNTTTMRAMHTTWHTPTGKPLRTFTHHTVYKYSLSHTPCNTKNE